MSSNAHISLFLFAELECYIVNKTINNLWVCGQVVEKLFYIERQCEKFISNSYIQR